ncbi:MAG: hypothetical protein KF846_14670 [Cyclobacteriaceae bacterium]|nr:hypothetical protein [Cyclobacteriaceae bacterium]MBX2957404.1 hypothetical protein [Cyclobacteriaceae bacterium]
MNFHSIGQYFYKLYSILFVLLLVPLVAFIFLYQALRTELVLVVDLSKYQQQITYVVGGVVISVWLVAYFIFVTRLQPMQKIFSLGERLSKYATLTIVRSVLFSIGLLLLAIGYFFSENQWLTIGFITSLLLPVLFWPIPSRVCRHLKLKGDERMMVLYKMDDL